MWGSPVVALRDIATPVASQIVDSSGAATPVAVTFTAGRGAYSGLPETVSPYGRLFNSFIYGTTLTTDPSWTPNASINLTGIPYSSYDVYVYFGSEFNGRTGTLSSTAAGTTYSFTTQVASGTPGSYIQTTDTGSGNPVANYAVFSGLSSATFDVTSTVTGAGPTLGIYGIQVVDTSGAGGPVISLSNPQKSGSVFHRHRRHVHLRAQPDAGKPMDPHRLTTVRRSRHLPGHRPGRTCRQGVLPRAGAVIRIPHRHSQHKSPSKNNL